MFPDISRDDIFRLETERLWLRWLRAADASAIAAFAGLADVARMTASIPHPYPPGEAERFILQARASTAGGDALVLAATTKAKGRSVVGLVSAQVEEPGEVEFGYTIGPAYAGRGYATEMVAAMIDAVFNLTEARALVANSRTINPASRRVLEKCGFVFTGTGLKDLPARGGKHPCDFFRRDRRGWASGHATPRRLPGMTQQAARTMPSGPQGEEPQ